MRSLLQGIIDRLKNEPILLLAGLSIALTTFQDAIGGGVDGDTALLASLEAVIGWVGRELVVPVRKTVQTDAGYAVLEDVPIPVFDEPDEPVGQ